MYMNSSPVMTMVLQPGVQPPRHHGTIPMEARLWDRNQKPPRPPPKRLTARRQEAPVSVPAAPSVNLSDAACNTARNNGTQTPKKRTTPTQTPRKRIQDRPKSAPQKKRAPNPLLGEGGYSSGAGGHHGGGLKPLRPPSAGIPNYNTFDDKHLIDHYKKKFGLEKMGKQLKNKTGMKSYKPRD